MSFFRVIPCLTSHISWQHNVPILCSRSSEISIRLANEGQVIFLLDHWPGRRRKKWWTSNKNSVWTFWDQGEHTHTYIYVQNNTNSTHTHAHLILFGLIWICLNGWCYNITAELFLQTECVITSFLFCTFRSDDLLWVICNSVSLRSVLHWDEVVRPPVKFMPCDRFPPSSLLDTRPPAAVKSSHVSHQGLLRPSCDHSSKTPRPLYTFL